MFLFETEVWRAPPLCERKFSIGLPRRGKVFRNAFRRAHARGAHERDRNEAGE
jgi:hypothetical protein